MLYQQENEILKNSVLKAGEAIKKIFFDKTYNVTLKSKDNPLTEADLLCNEIILESIYKNFPKDAVLSEEVNNDYTFPSRFKANRVWILDPIDGTKEFISGIKEFAISLALVDLSSNQPNPVLGMIYNPVEDFFIEFDSKKVYYNNSEVTSSINNNHKLDRSISICVSRSEVNKNLFNFLHSQPQFNITPIGSIAYKLGLVAAQQYDMVISKRPKNEWDIAGGLAICRALNYLILDKNFEPITLNKVNTISDELIVGPPEVIELYKRIFY